MANDTATIRDTRKQLGLTLVQMAGLLGIHHSQLSRWERGNRTPPAYLIAAVEHLTCPSMRRRVREAKA